VPTDEVSSTFEQKVAPLNKEEKWKNENRNNSQPLWQQNSWGCQKITI